MGVLKGKEKWRPDRIGAPEAREIRRGRWEGPSRRSKRGAEGDCPTPLGPKEPAGLPGEVPPQDQGWGACLDAYCSVEPKTQPLQPPRPFPALWVLSIGPVHCPNHALA